MFGINIVLVTTFCTAIVAQFLNSFLSSKREQNKVLREIFENYIVTNLSYSLEFAHRISMNMISTEDLLENLENISKNLLSNVKYGDKNILSKKLELMNLKNIMEISNSTQAKTIIYLQIQYYFLIYSKKLIKKLNIKLQNNMENSLNYSIRLYAYLISVRVLHHDDRIFKSTQNKVVSITRFNFDSFSKISKSNLKKLEKNLDDFKNLEIIYNTINTDFNHQMIKFRDGN